jgi:hypothetical protein
VFESFIDEDAVNCGPILIFATKDDLIALFDAPVFAADGTFRIKPKPFAAHRSSQVFTLNSFFGVENSRRLYRRVLVLMPKRTKVSIVVIDSLYIITHLFSRFVYICFCFIVLLQNSVETFI